MLLTNIISIWENMNNNLFISDIFQNKNTLYYIEMLSSYVYITNYCNL